jgi:hypothetical protein
MKGSKAKALEPWLVSVPKLGSEIGWPSPGGVERE